jgi:hypothetical protein
MARFRVAGALPDRQPAQGDASEVQVELAGSGLDGEREGPLPAEPQLVAWYAPEDGRDPPE